MTYATAAITNMGGPAKRRKKNNYNASDKPVRSLDYFFAKQKGITKGIPAFNGTTNNPQKSENADVGTFGKQDEATITDEELARRLHKEWNHESHNRDASNSDGPPESHKSPSADIIAKDAAGSTVDDTKAPKSDPEYNSNSLPETVRPKQNTLTLQSTAAEEDTISANIPFDESPLTFDPSKYVPTLQSHWASEGGNATYALLTRCFVLVNGTQSRIKIVDTLVNLLRTIIEGDPESLLPAVRPLRRSYNSLTHRTLRSGSLRTPSLLHTSTSN